MTGNVKASWIADQLATHEREVDAEMRRYFAGGGQGEPLSTLDLEIVGTFRPSTVCEHIKWDSLAPALWSPRRAAHLMCGRCFANARATEQSDPCDSCGVHPASGWREVRLPPKVSTRSDGVTRLCGPIHFQIRLCDGCQGVEHADAA
jgi:hypothetical protein